MAIDILAMSGLVAKSLEGPDESFRIHRPLDARLLPAESARHLIRGIVATGDAPIGGELAAALPALEIVSLFGAGYDGIDIEALRARRIVVTNTPDVLSADVADLAVALWISVARRLVVADRYVRAGSWKQCGPMPLASTASGRACGILGLGRIGLAIARRCGAMDMVIHYYSRTPRELPQYTYWSDLEKMAAAVDVLFVACPGGPATRHLVNASVIRQLGPGGTLINVSRGSVVDEAAMVEALTTGQLGGAGLDVFEQEPGVPDALTKHPGAVLTPHIGSATVETRRAMGDQMVENLQRHFSGLPARNRLS